MAKKKIDDTELMENELETDEVQEVQVLNDEDDDKSISDGKKHWYIVHTYSGYENKVKINLEKRIEYMNMSDRIFRIEVPQKTITKVTGGKKQERDEKIFPGYVLVEMIMDNEAWELVKNTSGVTKFISSKASVRGNRMKPIPVRESEIKRILYNQQQTQVTKIQLDVKVGEQVKITSGPFADFIGEITEVYPDKYKLRANVSIFGRETPVELEYKQIQKL